MNEKDFIDSPTGHLVRTSIYLVPYPAFVPNPLPPSLKASWEITSYTLEAQQRLSELKGIGRGIENPNIFIRPFIRKEAVLSSKIEGTRTELIDLLAYEINLHPVRSIGGNDPAENDIQEVLNYVKAMDYGIKNINSKIDENFLCNLHKVLLKDVRGQGTNPGKFRETQNYIGKEQNPDSASFIPPPIEEMGKSIKQLVYYINTPDQYPPLIRIALIHYQLETIHPFADGNGRIGRLLNTILLIKWGLLDTPLLYLSGYLEKNRDEYYRLLLDVSKDGNWENWLIFFIKAVINQSSDATNRIKKLQDLKKEWLNKSEIQRASVNIIRLIDRLFVSPYLTVSEAQKYLAVTNRAARMNMTKLIDAGILKPAINQKYGQLFVADQILSIFKAQ